MSSMCQLCYGSGEVMRKHTALHGRSYFGQAMCTKGLSIITHHVILGCRQAGISGGLVRCAAAMVRMFSSGARAVVGAALPASNACSESRIPPGMPSSFQQI